MIISAEKIHTPDMHIILHDLGRGLLRRFIPIEDENVEFVPGYVFGKARAPLVLSITLFISIMATALVSLRFFVRQKLFQSFGKEEWTTLASCIFNWANCVVGIWAVGVDFRKKLPGDLINPHSLRMVSYKSGGILGS